MSHRPAPRNIVIRRSPQRTTQIELPLPPEPPEVPHVGRHAKIFALALFAIVALGAALLMTPWTSESGTSTNLVDALFTAVSAASVTGLVTLETQEHWNFWGELVILLLIQSGGLGFMVGASLVLQTLRRGQARLADSILIQHGSPTLSLREAGHLTRRIVRFTFAAEALGALILTLLFARDRSFQEAAWHGLFHSVSAFCNAGFDLQGGFSSLTSYDSSPLVNITFMLLIQGGALSYVVFSDLASTRRWGRLRLDTKLVLWMHVALLVSSTLLFMAAEWNGALSDVSQPLRPMAALFQSVSARTAGFASVNFADVHTVTLFAWVGVMLVGGASGSTAGGAKLSTVGVIAAAVVSTLRGREEAHVFNRRLETTLVFRAIAVVVLMMMMHFTVTLALIAVEDWSGHAQIGFLALMFESMSALATVGLSTGITPTLSTLGKLILCGAMFFGRLGPLTAVYALQRRQRPLRYRLPSAPVRIG